MGNPSGLVLDKIDLLIKNTLKKNRLPLSTYEIAKRLDLSWGTATVHCFKLKSLGIIDCEVTDYKKTLKRTLWRLKGGRK